MDSLIYWRSVAIVSLVLNILFIYKITKLRNLLTEVYKKYFCQPQKLCKHEYELVEEEKHRHRGGYHFDRTYQCEHCLKVKKEIKY